MFVTEIRDSNDLPSRWYIAFYVCYLHQYMLICSCFALQSGVKHPFLVDDFTNGPLL